MLTWMIVIAVGLGSIWAPSMIQAMCRRPIQRKGLLVLSKLICVIATCGVVVFILEWHHNGALDDSRFKVLLMMVWLGVSSWVVAIVGSVLGVLPERES